MRPRLASDRPAETAPRSWRASSGTAAVLGLCPARLDVAPTTAYLMLGSRCARNCGFCTQARDSLAESDTLSRVAWPAFDAEELTAAVAAGFASGAIGRACFQVTVGREHVEQTVAAVRKLAAASRVPICASILPHSLDDVAHLLASGADRVTIALDGATEAVYAASKGGTLAPVEALLRSAAERFPGRIGTHLIAGLGETEQELIERLAGLLSRGIHVSLFAFTPVAGTALAHRPAPPLDSYRRIQAARWLLAEGRANAARFCYTHEGQLAGLGVAVDELRILLATGAAFETSGCPHCNRPYYNERPGGPLYNYPRPLSAIEAHREVEGLIASL